MSSRENLMERYNHLYSSIETQINQLSSCSLITLESNHIKSFKKGSGENIKKTHIKSVIEAAKMFDAEIKSFVSRPEKKKAKPVWVKSTMPPIWNDAKLKTYIENVMNELDIPSEESLTTSPIHQQYPPKSILKKKNVELKRNVGTNVKFLSSDHQKNQEQSKYKATITEGPVDKKKDEIQCKRMLTIKTNDSEIESLTTSGTLLFAHRTERVPNDEKNETLQLPKANRPQSAPSKLVFAPITFTSTSESGKNDDIVMLADSNLATTHMTKCFLPVLSIKRKCSIQRIYQLEILPTCDLQHNEDCRTKNVHFYEYLYEAPADNKMLEKLNTTSVVSQDIVRTLNEALPTPNDPHVPQSIERDEISATFSNLQTILNEIKFNNGKFHVVVEGKPVERKRKILRKKAHANFPKKSSGKKKSAACERLEVAREENSTSSLSDEKVREFFGYERKQIKCSSSNASCEPSSSPSSVPIKNHSLNDNFKSFYELFENTFEDSQRRDEVKKDHGVELESDLVRMKEIITLSEENIKKAGKILQKYHQESKTVTSNMHDVSLQTTEIENPQVIELKPPDECLKVDSCVQTIADKNMQTEGSKSRHYFKHIYDKYSNFNDINFDQPPSRPQQSTTTSSLIAKYLNDTVPYNTSYQDNDDVMEMANKFLRSVEKRKKKFSRSESCSELSSLDLNDRMSEKGSLVSELSSKKEINSVDKRKTKVGSVHDLNDIETSSISDDSISSSVFDI